MTLQGYKMGCQECFSNLEVGRCWGEQTRTSAHLTGRVTVYKAPAPAFSHLVPINAAWETVRQVW